jgi:glc operon protein GlcG
VSIGKARTAALFKKPTRAFEDSINGGRVALAAVHEMTPLQGGVPIVHDGQVVGAIGVSGAHSQAEDEEVALAGASAVGAATPATSR